MNAAKSIVIVEDDETLLELLRAKFAGAGFAVRTARDGVSGFDLIKESKPALVLLDMFLPRLNGLRVLEKMKEEGLLPAIPVLIISNSGQPIELQRALDLGARDYLIKVNFNPKEVLVRAMGLLGAALPPPAGEREPHTEAKVLIVEDDMLLVRLLEQKFMSAGYKVYCALDAEQARHALIRMEPDIILLDLVLPGANGLAFLKELKRDEKNAKIPVLIISNLGQREEVDKGLRLGATDYIVKADSSPAEIVEKAASLIGRNT